jgi:hypothetical protein
LAIFILGAGHKDLCRPIRRARLLGPVVASSFMLASLVAGLTAAFGELLRFDGEDPGGGYAFCATLVATWIFWGVVLYLSTRNALKYRAIFHLAKLVFAGSVAEMLAAVPSHLIVSRRPGCFVGIATAVGILAGLFVMLWSFGPAILLLFLQEPLRREGRETPDETEPPVRRVPFQFSLRTMLLVMLATGVVCGLLRKFWGGWPAAVVAAWTALVLLLPLVAAHRWLLGTGLLSALAGVVWAFWGEWPLLSGVVLPMAVLGLVLVKVFSGRWSETRSDPPPSNPEPRTQHPEP